jgi:hypothetical protein
MFGIIKKTFIVRIAAAIILQLVNLLRILHQITIKSEKNIPSGKAVHGRMVPDFRNKIYRIFPNANNQF